jgi:uncharacterized protein YhaN
MRIERIRVDAFGRLRDLDTGERPLPGLVVVLGPNEAGKSTLFHFLTSILYGFQPATRDGNPYAPWKGGDPAGGVTLRLDDGRCASVDRRLQSQPSGQAVLEAQRDELRNRPVAWVHHVPRNVFRQVFAVTLGELARLDGETWDRVQHRILGAMGATDLRPVRGAVEELEREAGELWRPSRRGNQRVRDLRAQERTLRERRRMAAERDRSVRELIAEGAAARRELAAARRERQRVLVELERLEELMPVRRQLQRIASLGAEAGDLAELEGLPSDPADALSLAQRRTRELSARLADLDAERSGPLKRVEAVDSGHRKLLEHRDQIRSLLSRVGGTDPDRARLAALEQEIRDLERRLEAAVGSVVAQGEARDPAEVLCAVSLATLRERVGEAVAAREQRRVLERASARERPRAGGRLKAPLLPAALLVVGVVAMVAGIVTQQIVATVVGVVVAIVGADAWLPTRWRPSGISSATVSPTVEGARAAEAAANAAVEGLFSGVSLTPSVLTEPGDNLVTTVERIQEVTRDRGERMAEAEAIRLRLARLSADAEDVARATGVAHDPDARTLAHSLDAALSDAEATETRAEAAQAELVRLDRARVRAAGDLAAAEAALGVLRRRLEAEGGGDAAAGAAALRKRLEARDRAAGLRSELLRTHPDLASIRSRIAEAEASGESWVADPGETARLKTRAEELADAAQRLAATVEARDRDAAHLREAETVDAVDGEAAALAEEVQRLVRERDRLWVLSAVLRDADRRFREEHQPDLMRRAGEHLSALTSGRYDRILADDDTRGDRFLITGPGVAGPIALAPPVSTGTLEQAYLALRLAIVDHLDDGLEPLPLFVDEVFVNWDRARRREGLRVLAGLADRRQLFVFTCHETTALELEAQGGRLLRLGTED